MKNKMIITRNYNNLLDRIGEILVKARTAVVREINKAQVLAYWEIGREIVEFEQKGKAEQNMEKNYLKDFRQTCLPNLVKGFPREI